MHLKSWAVKTMPLAFVMALLMLFPATASAATGSISIQGKPGAYTGLSAAITAAVDGDVLMVSGTISQNSPVNIDKDITLIADAGGGIVEMSTGAGPIKSAAGKKLTLGSGSAGGDLLTIETPNETLEITNGELVVRSGVDLFCANTSGKVVELRSSTAAASIVGGSIRGGATALDMSAGARVTEISGCTIQGYNSSIHMSDAGTKIEVISGGTFERTRLDSGTGTNVHVQNQAQIGTISGGTFTTPYGDALAVMRSGWIGEITGNPSFTSTHVSDPISLSGRGITIWPAYGSSNDDTGIGTISGGTFRGELAVFVVGQDATHLAKINTITGGTFQGTHRGLQVDAYAQVDKISGGTFSGDVYGLLNAGSIGSIEGTASIKALIGAGLLNRANAIIGAIHNGTIMGDDKYGIDNVGTISLISGGTIIGKSNAVHNSGQGKVITITGGTFWGKQGDAIALTQALSLEPGLTNETQGVGRYWGGSGKAFNNENLVTLPNGYHISRLSELVAGIAGTEFKYLTRTYTLNYDANGGNGSMAYAEGEYSETETIAANAFARDGYSFIGWNTETDGSGTNYVEGKPYSFAGNLTLYAQWEKPEASSSLPPSSSSSGDALAKAGDGRETFLVKVLLVVAGAALGIALLRRVRQLSRS